MNQNIEQKNARLARNLGLIALSMFGFGYAMVPLYDVLCEWKWIERDRPDAVKAIPQQAYEIDVNRDFAVDFVTELNERTPLEFHTDSKRLTVHPGQYHTVNFYATNKTDKEIVARAIASFSPALISKYFEKVQCFCFEEQVFKPFETKTMPMRFVINPEMPKEYKAITLAYTFFDNTDNSVNK